MYPISRILVPVDFSERCLEMIPYAALLGAKYDAEILLLHAINPIYSIPAIGGIGPILVPLPESMIKAVSERLDTFAADLLQGLNVKRLVYEGDPVEQVTEFAESGNVQLVVVPTHGHGMVRRFLLGSVTAKILHDVPCPVLTSRQPETSPKAIHRILCAVDLRPPSQGILTWASQMARDLGATLSIVHVVPRLHSHLDQELAPTARLAEESDARARLVALVTELDEEVAPACDTYVQEGEVIATISSLAHSINADLLVIGRGREADGIKPTGYSIIRQAPCAVLSV
ncbi:MAG: universal stress protein [Bryobacteraceae bacterium]